MEKIHKDDRYVAGMSVDLEDRKPKAVTIYLTLEGFFMVLALLAVIVVGILANRPRKQPGHVEMDLLPVAAMAGGGAIVSEAVSDTEAPQCPARKRITTHQLVAADNDKSRREVAYILRFQEVAIAEMHKFGIPASIKMAQALIESDAGASSLAAKHHNHFGIKCKERECKQGHCVNYYDDSHKDFFLVHKSAWESFRKHSEILANPEWRYAKLINACGIDYECWAEGLKKAGYSTNKQYDNLLKSKIRQYNLHILDEGHTFTK